MISNAQTISEAFARLPRYADRTFLVTDTPVTYGQLHDRARLLRAFFLDRGMEPGARVFIASRDDIACSELFLASLASQFVPVLIDPETTNSQLQTYLKTALPSLVLADKLIFSNWDLPGHLPFVAIADNQPSKSIFDKLLGRGHEKNSPDCYPSILNRYSPSNLPEKIDGSAIAYIIFTSGTTASPKAVEITHDNINTHLATLGRQFSYDSESRLLNVLPLHHVGGLVQGPLVVLMNLAILFRPFEFSISNIQRYFDTIYTARITHAHAVPTMLALFNKFGEEHFDAFQTDEFKILTCSGSKLNKGVWQSFEQRFGVRITNFYGLTETVTGGLFCGPDDETYRFGTIGKTVDCEAKIVDDKKVEMPSGSIGELAIKGGNVMRGYHNNSVLDEDVFHEDWFMTGDYAFEDEDEFIHLKGRKKSLIITGAINVMPEEVNECLLDIECVTDAATFGIPDEFWGEIVACSVVQEDTSDFLESEIITHCRNRLGSVKAPKKVFICDAIPRNRSGKVDYAKLVEQVDQEQATVTCLDGTVNRILGVASRVFKESREALNVGLGASNILGWDSLTHLYFVTELEEEFDMRFSTLEIMQTESIQDALDVVLKRTNDT